MKSVLTAFRVLTTIGELQPVGVSEIARVLDIPKSTAHRSAKVLEEAGLIRLVNRSSPRWVLTPMILTLGARVGTTTVLREASVEVMHLLGRQTGETVHLVVPDGRHVVLISKVPSVHNVQPASSVGQRSPIHATASGKAILAAMPWSEVVSLLSGELDRVTDKTSTTLEQLGAELDTTRARGFAVNRDEYRVGVSSIGAAIVVDDHVFGGLTVSVPSHRFDDEKVERWGPELVNSARSIVEAMT